MSKSLQKGILFAVCVALVLAISLTLVFFAGGGDKNLTAPQGQVSNAAQNNTSYTHGSNIGRAASGTPVRTGEELLTALRNNETINLQNDIIDLASSIAFPRSADGYLLSYSSTIYGNGYTISFAGRHSEESGEWANPTNSSGTVIDWKQTINYYGGIVGQLAKGGHIYDLNVVMKSGNIAFKSNDEDIGDTWLDVGGIAGIVESGASIENCTFTISQENSRLASLKWPETTMWQPAEQWGRAGGIAGELNGGSIINCTVTNNGSIEAGDSGRNDYVTGSTYRSAVGNIVGWIGSGTIQNVRVSGSGSLNAFKVGNIGVLKSGSTISTQNFYNNFSGTFDVFNSTDGGSSSSAYDAQSGSMSATITNMFTENNATSGSVTGTVNTITNTSNIPSNRNYSVYFDPKQGTNYGSSLAIAFNQAPAASYKYTLVSGGETTYENPETTSSAIVFRKLPTAATTWNRNGNFTAELKSESVGPQHRQPTLQPYEHGYATSQTSTGTPIDSGSKFQGLFSRTGTVEADDTGTYYLTEDIVITGFTGKQFAGTLDGNGHTIYIAASDTSLAGHTLTGYNGNAVGGVIGALSGTIKNVRVVIDANITVGLNANLRGRVGGVVGRLLNGGSIENVQVIIPGDVTLSYTNAGARDVSMGAVVGQATGASTISGLTVQMDGTLAPVGSYVWVSAVVGEIQAKSDHADTVSMNNIIVRGSGTFAAEASEGTGSGEPPYVSALATFNNGENYTLVNLDGLIYDFAPTFSADGSAMYGLFVNNDSDGNTANYGNYVADSNLFIMQGREYTPTKTGTQHAGNTYIPLDSKFRTINNTVDGLTSSSVAAYFEPGSTNLLRVQVSATWGTERLTVSGITDENGTPLMTSLVTAGDSSSDRFVRLTKEKIAALTADEPVKLIIFEHVSDPALKTALTYTGSALTPEITLTYKGAQLNKDTDYEMGEFAAVDGTNAKVDESTGLPLNAGKYTVTITLKGADHWFAVHGSGGDAGEGTASKTATFEFAVAPKNVTMQDPDDSMAAEYGTKYWILSDNNVWGLDENLFFDEVVGKVEYTATVTRTDGGSGGYASTSGWLKAGEYTVSLSINDKNFAISGNSSIEYPLTITPVDINYTLTVDNSVAAIYDGTVRTITGAPQAGSGIIGTALEGSAGTAGDSVTAAVSVKFGDSAAQIQNAGDYVLSVTLSGADAENYTAALTSSWSEGGAIESNTITVEKRSLDLQWSFDSNVALEYGNAITDELIAETQLSDAIPYNGGSYTGSISFTVTSATYNGGTAYAPGVAAGTSVTFEVAPVLPDELDENNYTISLSAAGGETKTVGQRTLTVDYDAFAMTAAYGDSISNEWLTEQYKEQIAQSITNIYNNEDVTFKIILYSRNSGGGYTEINDFADLKIGATYMAAVVLDGNSNYTIPDSLSNGYDFTLTARALTISDITWEEEGFGGVYDGKEHALKAVLAEGSQLVGADALADVFQLSRDSLTNVSESGAVSVTVASTFADKYTLTGTTSFNVTLAQKTLTVSPYEADFLDYDLNSLYDYLISADSGFITGAVEGDTLTFLGTAWETETSAPPTNVEIGGKSYVAAGSYVLNMVLSGDSYTNYKFEDNAMSVTINALDISGAVVTWNESLTYTAAEQSVSLDSVTVNGVALPVEWFNLTNNAGTDAKTYTADIAANNSNITGSTTKEFTIAPYSVTVKWEVTGEISVGKVMPSDATKISDLGLTANVTEFNAPGITDSAQYSIVVTASGFEAGHTFAAGENVTLTPSMTFAEGVTAGNYDITFDPATITKTVAATPVTVKPVNGEQTVIYGSSVTNAEEFIAAAYFTIESGAEGAALTADNFTVTITVTDSEGEAVFGMHGLAAGTYTVTIEGKGAYSVSNEDNSFTYKVDPLTLTAGTWSGVDDLTYDGDAAAPVFTPEGVLDGDSVTPTVTVTDDNASEGQAINAGTYTATATSDNANYVFDGTINVKEFTIAQMVLKGDWEVKSDMDMTYDGTDKSAYVTWKWTTAPLNDGDVTFEITFNGEKTAVNAGNYTATVTFTDSTGNYDTQSGILQGNTFDEMTIKTRPVVIAWTAPADLTYSATAKVPGYVISNKVDEDVVTATITYNGDNTNVTAEGFTATVTALDGAAKDNYTLVGGTGITSEKYTITALDVPYKWSFVDSAAITYGDGVDKVKALVTLPDGALLGTEEKVTFEVSVGEYTAATNAGAEVAFTVDYNLPEGVNADNYHITVNAKDGNNTLTVDKAQITFTGNAVTEQKIVGETLKLTQKDLLAIKYYTITPTPDDTYSVDGKLSVTSVKKGDAEITLGADGYTFTEAGEYIVTYAITTADGDNYAPVSDTFTATLTVSEEAISLTPTWSEYTFTYNGEAQYPVPTFNQTPDEGAIVYTVTARGDSALTDNSAVNAGDYTVTISVAEGFEQKYEFAEDATRTFDFTIGQLEAQLTWLDEDPTYDGQEHILTATVKNKVEGDDVTVEVQLGSGNNINVTAEGFTFTATGLTGTDAGNYKLPADVLSGKFEIKPATLEISAVTLGENGVYNGKEKNAYLSVTYSVAPFGEDSPAVVFAVQDYETKGFTNAGEYTVNVSLAPSDVNYTLGGTTTFTVTIEKATLTLTQAEGASLSKVYDGEVVDPQSLLTPENVTVAGMQNGEDAFELGILSIAAEAESEIKNAAGYKLTVSVNEGNYTAQELELTYTVTAKLIDVEWNDTQFTYDGAAHKPTATATNLVGDETLTLTVTGEQTNASKSPYTATVEKSSVTGNYMLEEDATVEFTIAPKTIGGTWSGLNGLTYTAGTAAAGVFTLEGVINPDSVSVGYTYTGEKVSDNRAVDAGDYTVTAYLEGEDAHNYALDGTATTSFTIAPATLNVSVVIAGDGVAENTLTWKVEAEVTVSGNSEEGWTLTSGGTSYIVTVTGADGVALDVLQLTLNGSEYNGTPYGTRVQNGKLGVASTNPNYTVELVTPININIVPDISIEINTGEGYENTAVYNVNTTYTTADFEDYFYIDGQPEGTWAYSVEGVESGSFSDVGTYTVKATFTITASGIQLENHFTFTITQATVTGVVLNGEGAYTYGGLKAGDTVSVTVTYSDDAEDTTVNATFKAATSTGGYVKAGERVTLTLTGDDGTNDNYAKVDGQTVTVSVSKAEITADIYYEDTASVDGVLTLPYNGKEGYVVSVKLTGVRDGDVIYGALTKQIIDAATYNSLEIALGGNDAECYEVTNAADLSVVVTPKEITVEWSNYDGFTYDGTAKAPTATAKGTFDSDEVPLSVTVTGETTEGQAINAGDYTATVAAFVQDNYKLSADSVQSFSIAKATATLGIDNYQDSVEYNGSAVTVTPTVDGAAASEGIVNVTIAYTAADGSEAVSVNEIRNAGSYTVTLQISGALNYEDASKDFAITVTPAELTVTTANKSFTYGDEIDLGATVNAISGDDVSAVIDRVEDDMGESAELKNAGSYTVTYRLEGAAAGNYTITAGGSVEVTIGAKALTFTWNSDQTFTYNGAAQVPGYTLNGVVDSDEVTLTVTVTGETTEGQAINAGDYTATVTREALEAALGSNYTLAAESVTQEFTISPATVTAEDVQAVYGEVFTAAATDTELQRVGGWQIVTFNGKAVEVKVTVTDSAAASAARAGEVYLDADTYEINIQLESSNFTFGASSAQTTTANLTVARKQLKLAPELPSDLTYSSDGIVIGTPDHASQLVGDDTVEVTMLIDGQPYVAGETVLSAGEHTVTFEIKDASGNYDVADTSSSTFTVAKKYLAPSINVAGDTVENNSTLEMDKGENMRVETAIDNFIADNGIKEGEYTLSVKDASGADKKLDEIAAWAPGTYTVTVALGDNYDGSLTFSIVVKEGTTAQIPEPPALPSTPLEDSGSSLSTTDWLFPLIIAVECLIAAVLVAAIVIAAIKRSK